MDFTKIQLNDKDIEQLLQRYWAGDTSIPEEKMLKAYFAQEPQYISEQFLPFRSLFVYFEAAATHNTLSENFDEQLLSQLSTSNNGTGGAKIRTLTTRRGRGRMIRWIGAAASVLLLIGAGLWMLGEKPLSPAPERLTLEDLSPQERRAYEQTKLALIYVSTKLNQGTGIATESIIKINELTESAD